MNNKVYGNSLFGVGGRMVDFCICSRVQVSDVSLSYDPPRPSQYSQLEPCGSDLELLVADLRVVGGCWHPHLTDAKPKWLPGTDISFSRKHDLGSRWY